MHRLFSYCVCMCVWCVCVCQCRSEDRDGQVTHARSEIRSNNWMWVRANGRCNHFAKAWKKRPCQLRRNCFGWSVTTAQASLELEAHGTPVSVSTIRPGYITTDQKPAINKRRPCSWIGAPGKHKYLGVKEFFKPFDNITRWTYVTTAIQIEAIGPLKSQGLNEQGVKNKIILI